MSESRVIVGDIGWCIAKLEINQDGLASDLTLISPAHTSPERYAPAESVCISSRDNIVKLRTFLLENIQIIEQGRQAIADKSEEEQVPA